MQFSGVGGAYHLAAMAWQLFLIEPMHCLQKKELEKIYNDRNEFYKKLMQMIDTY